MTITNTTRRAVWKRLSVAAAAGVGFWACGSASAQTLAHWRFEAGPDGAQVQVLSDPNFGFANGANFSPDIPDSSGNGNALGIWDEGGAGFRYENVVPGGPAAGGSGPTLADGTPNLFSIKNTGGGPASFTETGAAIQSVEPAQFTVEASIKMENGGWRTFVGRDARGIATNDQAAAAFYFQSTPESALRVAFTDKAGFTHVAVSPNGFLQRFNFPTDPDGLEVPWYNVAAVSDGSTLSLYAENADTNSGYQLVARTNLLLSGSTDTALNNGSNGDGDGPDGAGTSPDGGDWNAGDWTVGRGLYNGGHADRAYGYIDEVRISSAALKGSDLLFNDADLSLVVNTTNGSVSIRNNTGAAIAIDNYEVRSSAGQLLTANFSGGVGWNSLNDQNLNPVDGPDADATLGNSPGETWDEAGGVTANVLSEIFQLGETSIAAGASLSLGNPYNFNIAGAGNAGDLDFFFGRKGGPQILANVVYAGAGVQGDFNGDGFVDAADYTVWRDNLGMPEGDLLNGNGSGGTVDASDYQLWKTSFGDPAVAALGAAGSAVPEPATGVALLIGGALATLIVRRRS